MLNQYHLNEDNVDEAIIEMKSLDKVQLENEELIAELSYVATAMKKVESKYLSERNLIRERTQAGLQATRARGRKGGRPKILNKGNTTLR